MTFFSRSHDQAGERFTPLPDAANTWTGKHLRGPAATALLGRAVEHSVPEELGMLTARSTFDLHDQIPLTEYRTRARVLKRGRSLWLTEAELLVDRASGSHVVARCRATFIAPTTRHHAEDAHAFWPDAVGEIWDAPHTTFQEASHHGRLYRTPSTGWGPTFDPHRNAEKNAVWYHDLPVIIGEEPSAFQLAARVADLANYTNNFGALGLEYINTDVTLSLVRAPHPGGIGVISDRRIAHAGLTTGVATLYDRFGVIGTSATTSLFFAPVATSTSQ